jgi:serine/threonine-protein kinase RsbW
MRCCLPSTKESINEAVNGVVEIADGCGMAEDCRTDLEIALREALANAVKHGNEYGTGKNVFVRCYASAKSGLLVLVRDEGSGFDPAEVPDPRDEDRVHLSHGRGLFLMRALVDFVEHRKDGREVVLYKATVRPAVD